MASQDKSAISPFPVKTAYHFDHLKISYKLEHISRVLCTISVATLQSIRVACTAMSGPHSCAYATLQSFGQFSRLIYCSQLYKPPLVIFSFSFCKNPSSATLVCYYIFFSLFLLLRFFFLLSLAVNRPL